MRSSGTADLPHRASAQAVGASCNASLPDLAVSSPSGNSRSSQIAGRRFLHALMQRNRARKAVLLLRIPALHQSGVCWKTSLPMQSAPNYTLYLANQTRQRDKVVRIAGKAWQLCQLLGVDNLRKALRPSIHRSAALCDDPHFRGGRAY